MEFHLHLPIRYPNMPQLLLKARDSLLQHFRPILNHFGVTEQQWRIMRALNESPTLEPRELCNICQISSPSMSGILARMEEIGLIGRSKFEGDQRRRKVHLSEAGASLLLQMGKLIDLQYATWKLPTASKCSKTCAARWKPLLPSKPCRWRPPSCAELRSIPPFLLPEH